MKIFATVCVLALIAVSASADDITAPGLSSGGEFIEPVTDCPGEAKFSSFPGWSNGGASQYEDWFYPGDPNCYLTAELADDFPNEGHPITAVRWWTITTGAPYADVMPFVINIWMDAGTCPDEDALKCTYKVDAKTVEVAGYPGLPSYEHCAVLPEPCEQTGGVAWFSAPAAFCRAYTGYGQNFHEDHTPVNWGNELCFRSAYFGYPNWVPGSVLWGEFYDGGF
jgi:hypothetical protein